MSQFKPILFSTPMVKAILAGNKTQTRRIIKYKKKIENPKIGFTTFTPTGSFSVRGKHESGNYGESFFKLPFQFKDIIWVREKHYKVGIWVKNGLTKTGKDRWEFKATNPAVCFAENPPVLFEKSRNKEYPEKEMWYQRNSLFMEMCDARLFLTVKSVGVEKLQDITNENAKAEGIGGVSTIAIGKNFTEVESPMMYRGNFQNIWDSINGDRAPWETNPYVWAIEFEVLKGSPLLVYMGRPVIKQETFQADGTFESLYAAQRWLQKKGYSAGSSCAMKPTAIMKGDYYSYKLPHKWKNFTTEDIASVHGVMVGDSRQGPVNIYIFK